MYIKCMRHSAYFKKGNIQSRAFISCQLATCASIILTLVFCHAYCKSKSIGLNGVSQNYTLLFTMQMCLPYDMRCIAPRRYYLKITYELFPHKHCLTVVFLSRSLDERVRSKVTSISLEKMLTELMREVLKHHFRIHRTRATIL